MCHRLRTRTGPVALAGVAAALLLGGGAVPVALAQVPSPTPGAPVAANAPQARATAPRAAVPSAQAPALSAQERRIAAWVDGHVEEAIGFLERSVNVNSGSLNLAGVRAMADLYAPELAALGFETRWIPMPDSMRRAGHLLAERGGTRGRCVLLVGHLDTVFEPDGPFQRFERQGSRAVGPGVNDMKGGNTVILWALKALQSVGALDGAHVIVAFTGDEESVGRPHEVSRRDLVDAARRCQVSLEFETAVRDSIVEYATIARRSATGWRLAVTGRTAHTSGVFSPGVGAGAVFEASRILHRFYEELREQYVTFSSGLIVGGTEAEIAADRGTAEGKSNVVPRTVLATGDLRTLSPEQEQRVRDRMRAIVAENLPRTSATIAFTDGYPPMAPTEGNRRLFEMLDRVTVDMGLPPMQVLPPDQRGASDAAFVAPYTDVLSGMGVYGESAHAPGESMDLATFGRQITRTAILVYRLTR